MRRPQQLNFKSLKPRLTHGGSPSIGRRKTRRPIDPRRPVHVVLKSTRAHGRWSLLNPRHSLQIESLFHYLSCRFKIRVYQSGNNGDHFHMLIKAPSLAAFQNFLRTFAGHLAQLVTGARKGRPVGKFWDALAFSRLGNWGKAFLVLLDYVLQNKLEGWGVIDRNKGERVRSVLRP